MSEIKLLCYSYDTKICFSKNTTTRPFYTRFNFQVTCPESQTEMRDQQCRQFDENFAFHQVQGMIHLK